VFRAPGSCLRPGPASTRWSGPGFRIEPFPGSHAYSERVAARSRTLLTEIDVPNPTAALIPDLLYRRTVYPEKDTVDDHPRRTVVFDQTACMSAGVETHRPSAEDHIARDSHTGRVQRRRQARRPVVLSGWLTCEGSNGPRFAKQTDRTRPAPEE